MGFPDKALADILEGREYEKVDEKCIRITGFPPIDGMEYECWEAGIAVKEVRDKDGAASDRDVLLRLREFQVALSTPMQCMMFLSDLQQSLR